ncbi:hypothetical protein DPMN_128568 [Dreissena polymorpha]|uniref:Uncharacterized protein n=1 Tax=Dreissena polymorpha TaxID=45954 RepID=A0A9D4GZR4_DREPO|nr:hypothetical protein DPMN_128568 [Dreissena polymorpha]
MNYIIWITSTFVILSTQNCCCFVRTDVDIIGYTKWDGTGGVHTYLYCDDFCITPDQEMEHEQCCACTSKTCWDVAADDPSVKCGVTLLDCVIELTLPTKGVVICNGIDAHVTVTVLYRLQSNNGRLLYLPENICAQSNKLIHIDMSENGLREIDALKCMHNLDYLKLRNNRINHVDNTTFNSMSYLRILDLHGNPILR